MHTLRATLAAATLSALLVGPLIALADAPLDTTAPTVTLTSATADPTSVSPIPVTATFSEKVLGFGEDDIVPGNATVGGFTQVGTTTYTFNLTPNTPNATTFITASINEHKFADEAGNENQGTVLFTRTFDPSVASSSATSTPEASSTALTLTFVAPSPDEGAVVASSSVSLAFESNGSVFTCTFGGAPYSCGSPQNFSGLGDSSYAFSVTAYNAANSASTTVTRHFTVAAATSTATTTSTGDTGTTTPATSTPPTTATNGGNPPLSSSSGGNGQIVGSGPTAPSSGGGNGASNSNLASGFYNPNPPILPQAPSTASASGSSNSGGSVAGAQTSNPSPSTATASSGSVPRSTSRLVAQAQPSASETSVSTPSEASSSDTVGNTEQASSTLLQGQGAAVATAGASAAVWFWGIVVLLALAVIGWLLYRSA